MIELADVTAAILAGGLGMRLRGVVTDRPKVLATIRGRPFLAYLLDQLVAAGIRGAVLCTGYMGDQVRDVLGKSYKALRLAYSQESAPLGTAGALRLALPLLNSNPVLVLNGDSYCAADLKQFWLWHRTRRANATLLLTRMSDTARYGRVQVSSDGTVTHFDEKGRENGPGWINAGVYLLNSELILEVPENSAVSLEREIFPTWIGRGLYGFQSEAVFLDIGTPEAYASAEPFFATGISR